MNSIAITIKPNTRGKKIFVEIDAEKLERLAANLGFYNPDFLKSVNKAEKDYQEGKVKKISSFRELRVKN